jgi:hypothetical protein
MNQRTQLRIVSDAASKYGGSLHSVLNLASVFGESFGPRGEHVFGDVGGADGHHAFVRDSVELQCAVAADAPNLVQVGQSVLGLGAQFDEVLSAIRPCGKVFGPPGNHH